MMTRIPVKETQEVGPMPEYEHSYVCRSSGNHGWGGLLLPDRGGVLGQGVCGPSLSWGVCQGYKGDKAKYKGNSLFTYGVIISF